MFRRLARAARRPSRPAATRPAGPAIFEPLEGRRLLAGFAANINFQGPTSPTPAGYVADLGDAYGSRGNGLTYGWAVAPGGSPVANPHTRDRNHPDSPDERYDSLNHLTHDGQPFAWEIAVPDDTYDVRLVVGDPRYFDRAYGVDVEGARALTGFTTSQDRWIDRTATAAVTDGRLTITSGNGDPQSRIAFVEIRGRGTGDPSADPSAASAIAVNFQPAGAPAAAGHRSDVGDAFGDRGDGRSFGWVNAAGAPARNANARDRNSSRSPDQRYDTLNHMNLGGRFNWELAVPNGLYTVRVVAGDPSYFESGYGITAEGASVVGGSTTSASPWLDGTRVVEVADGRLTIASNGAATNKLAFLSVVPQSVTNPPPDDDDEPTQPTAIQWAQAPAPNPSLTESQTAVVGGRMFLFGGFNNQFVPQRNVAMSYSSGTVGVAGWEPLAPMPVALTHAGVAVDGTKVYFAGGYVGNPGGGQTFGTTDVRVFDSATFAWSTTAPLPRARGGGSLVRLGRSLHFVGGQDANRVADRNDHWVLNLDDQAAGWKSVAPMLWARNHAGAVEAGGRMVIVGGQKGFDQNLRPEDSVQIYDPATAAWTQGAAVPERRSHVANSTFVHLGRIYVVAGEHHHGESRGTVFQYDPSANAWKSLTPLPDNRISPSAALVGGRLVVVGGHDGPIRTNAWSGTLA